MRSEGRRLAAHCEGFDALRAMAVARVPQPQLPVLVASKREQRAIARRDDQRVRVAACHGRNRPPREEVNGARHEDVGALAVPQPPKVAPAEAVRRSTRSEEILGVRWGTADRWRGSERGWGAARTIPSCRWRLASPRRRQCTPRRR
jgi:hypothetical protein